MSKPGDQPLKVKETDGVVWLFKKHVYDMLEIDNPDQTAELGDLHTETNWMDSAAFFDLIRDKRPKYGAKMAFLIRMQILPNILGKGRRGKAILKAWDKEYATLLRLGYRANI